MCFLALPARAFHPPIMEVIVIAMLKATYPPHIFKQVIQAFTSPDLPKRRESHKEISSIGYFDDSGAHSVFMFDVPDAEVAEFLVIQSRRSAFISARAHGFNSSVHFGQKVGDAIPNLMPMYS
jgi:hypothetical protein